MKYTPGPWESMKPKWTDPSRTRHICDDDGNLIARVDFANAKQSENEAIANAELIAAAPALLKALRGLLATCELNMDDMEEATRIAIVDAEYVAEKAESK